MKLGTILFLCVLLVVQKVAADSEQEDEILADSTVQQSSTAVPLCPCPTESNNQVSNYLNSQVNLTAGIKPKQLQVDPFSKFSADLYQTVQGSQSQNFILSPLSLRNALVMLSLGAAGETAEEFQKVLQLSANASELIKKQSQLTSSLKLISSLDPGMKLVMGDAVYVTTRPKRKQAFVDQVLQLGGEIERVIFSNGDAVAQKINRWVQRKTEGKIDKIVSPADLNDQMKVLLLNTIYFKGSWESPFKKKDTDKEPFFLNASCSMNVDMMFQQNKFQVADLDDANAKVILLPYQGERLSMMIYLPYGKDQSSLDDLESWLKDKSPFDIQTKRLGQSEMVKVYLPKFKIRSSLDLNEPLKTLGLGKMFGATADFSGIFSDSGNFSVSKVKQETFIDVNEIGTEAAGVTGSSISEVSTPTDFKADRPFLFQIVDNTTKTVLFSGRVKNPLDGTVVSESESEERSPRCIGRKSQVEEMLLDFVQFLAPNQTETNLTTRASRLQVVVDKYENKTKGAFELIQTMDNTLIQLEETEKVVENQTQRIEELEKERDGFRAAEGECRNEKLSQNQTMISLKEEVKRTLINLRKMEAAVKEERIQFLEETEARLLKSVKEWQNLTISQKESLERTSGQMKNLSDTLAQKIDSCPLEDPSPATPATTEETTTGFQFWTQAPTTEGSTTRPSRTTTRKVNTPEKEQIRPVGPSAALAVVYECGWRNNDWCGSTTEHQYDAARDGRCNTYSRGIKSVSLTRGCVTLYQNNNCSGKEFQLNTKNSDEGPEIRNQFLYTHQNGGSSYNGPRSIRPCSQ